LRWDADSLRGRSCARRFPRTSSPRATRDKQQLRHLKSFAVASVETGEQVSQKATCEGRRHAHTNFAKMATLYEANIRHGSLKVTSSECRIANKSFASMGQACSSPTTFK